MSSPPLWLQILYDWSQIATPIIALFGFIFVGRQIWIAKKQLDLDLEARKAGSTPYFDLHIPTSSNDTHWLTYEFALTNAGLAPAFQVEVSYVEAERVTTDIEFAAVTIGSTSKFTLKFPVRPNPISIELHIEYRNIYGDVFHQSWKQKEGIFKPDSPPKIIKE